MQFRLSKREIHMLLNLLDLDYPVTTKRLAEDFDVSVRTIKYDLDHIKLWLKQKKVQLFAQRNKGFWFELMDSERMALKNELLQVERYDLFPDQEIRIYQLIVKMCLTTDFMTAQQLADYLSVSKNTIMNDLEKMELLLNNYQVKLVRKNHLGFAIDGEENQIRSLMEFVIQKGITDYDIYHMMRILAQTTESKDNHSMRFGLHDGLQKIYQTVLTEMALLFHATFLEKFNYSEILAIVLRVSIATARMTMNRTMGRYKILENQQELLEKQELPYLLLKEVFDSYHFPILEDEYIYVFSDIFVYQDQHDIGEMTQALIQSVSKSQQLPFIEDQQLFSNLFAHLSLKLSKKYLFIHEYNPFVDDIKAKYPQLFGSIEAACKDNLGTSIWMTNDSFTSYIALHFLVSLEKMTINQKVVRVVYVCSTGLGVTSLIQQKMMEEVKHVEIASFASVLKAKEVIDRVKPELVVSIFPLEEITLPFIKVSPLPTKSDIAALKEIVAQLLENTEGKRMPRLVPRQQVGNTKGIEEKSREVILKGYILYEEFLKLFDCNLIDSYKEAFLLHVLLMVHRIYFNAQYENEGNIAPETLFYYQDEVIEMEAIFAKNQLSVNKAEITALLQYVKKENDSEFARSSRTNHKNESSSSSRKTNC